MSLAAPTGICRSARFRPAWVRCRSRWLPRLRHRSEQPKATVRDRGAGEDKVTFTSSILPRYWRRAKSAEELLPWLYLKGVSTGDFAEALEALPGPNAKGLSARTITRLRTDWWKDYEAWQKRDLGTCRFLYIRADGIYFEPRMSEEKQCLW